MINAAFRSPLWLLGLSNTPNDTLLIYAQRVIVGVSGETLAFPPKVGAIGERLALSIAVGLALPGQAGPAVTANIAATTSLPARTGVVAYG